MPSEYYDYADDVPDQQILRGDSDLLKNDNLFRLAQKYSYAYIADQANMGQIGSVISEQTLRNRITSATQYIAERDGRGIRDVRLELRHERESNGLVSRRSSNKTVRHEDDSMSAAVRPEGSIEVRRRTMSIGGMLNGMIAGDEKGQNEPFATRKDTLNVLISQCKALYQDDAAMEDDDTLRHAGSPSSSTTSTDPPRYERHRLTRDFQATQTQHNGCKPKVTPTSNEATMLPEVDVNLAEDIMKTTIQLVQRISSTIPQQYGFSARQQSPFAPGELRLTPIVPLLESFLGDTWEKTGYELQSTEGLRVTDMMSGLIWSFVLRNVLEKDDLRASNVSPTSSNDELLMSQIADLIDSMIGILQPYMARIEMLSESFTSKVDELWYIPLYDSLEQLIKSALHLKKVTTQTNGCKYEFVWPSQGQIFRPSIMQAVTHSGTAEEHVIALPRSMGLHAEFEFCGEVVKQTVRPAEVRLCQRKTTTGIQAEQAVVISEVQETPSTTHRLSGDVPFVTPTAPSFSDMTDADDVPEWMQVPDRCPPLSSLDSASADLSTYYRASPFDATFDLSSDPDKSYLHPKELRLASALHLTCAKYLLVKRRIFAAKYDAVQAGEKFNSHLTRKCNNIGWASEQIHMAFKRVGWFDDHWFTRPNDSSPQLRAMGNRDSSPPRKRAKI